MLKVDKGCQIHMSQVWFYIAPLFDNRSHVPRPRSTKYTGAIFTFRAAIYAHGMCPSEIKIY
jgi:hypothetical protein